MFARFDEYTATTLQDIKDTKRYRWTHARTHTRMDNVKTVYPPQTKFAKGKTNGEKRQKMNKIGKSASSVHSMLDDRKQTIELSSTSQTRQFLWSKLHYQLQNLSFNVCFDLII